MADEKFRIPTRIFIYLLTCVGQRDHSAKSDLSPREVIEIQLTALQTNNAEKPNAGIQQTWAFAHPNNRAVTGPIERFAKMLKNKNYRYLLGHKEYKIREVVVAPKIANFYIVIVSSDNIKLSFNWRLQKVETGDFIGSWMTTSVSPLDALPTQFRALNET